MDVGIVLLEVDEFGNDAFYGFIERFSPEVLERQGNIECGEPTFEFFFFSFFHPLKNKVVDGKFLLHVFAYVVQQVGFCLKVAAVFEVAEHVEYKDDFGSVLDHQGF
ncbi:hypothetical protein D3C72_874480 [compost metagenome]